jgi:hypothetical protein
MTQLTPSLLGYTHSVLTWSRAAFRDTYYQELVDAEYFRDGERIVVSVKYATVGDATYKFEFVTNYELEGSAVGFFTATAYNYDRGFSADGLIVIQGLSFRTQDRLDFWESAATHNYYVNTYLN